MLQKGMKKGAHHAVHGTSATLFVYDMVYFVAAESPSTLPVETATLITGKGLSAVPMRYCFPSTVWMTKARCS